MKITCALRKERKEAEISRRSTEKMRAEAGFKSHVKATRFSRRERGALLFIRSGFVTNRDIERQEWDLSDAVLDDDTPACI